MAGWMAGWVNGWVGGWLDEAPSLLQAGPFLWLSAPGCLNLSLTLMWEPELVWNSESPCPRGQPSHVFLLPGAAPLEAQRCRLSATSPEPGPPLWEANGEARAGRVGSGLLVLREGY